jgi:ATP/maltotriose-dependent transcriptional regulator MalT
LLWLWRTVKYEEVYLSDYPSPREAHQSLRACLLFYNEVRPHQALGYRTPAEISFAPVHCTRSIMSVSPAPHDSFTFVGRDRELGILRQHLTAALNGRGSLVLIGGEAGIGKTALAEALCREAEEQRTPVLVGRCYDLAETPPYGTWVELFGQYSPANASPLPDAFARPGTVGEVTSQAALFQQALDFLRALASQQPLLVLLDDLHWADLASLDLLRFLARSLTTMPLLLIVTYRSDELTRRHPLYALLPLLVREASAIRIDLRPLHREAITALVQARYHLPDADAAHLVAYLGDRSEGNPFFLGELLRTLTEEAVLWHTDGGWSLGALAGVQVPPLLRQVIDGRLARLGEEARGLLAIAAVIGQEVPIDLWTTVTETDEAGLLPVIARAVEARLLGEAPDGSGVRFVHALIREALYEGMLATQRRVQHRRIGDALAERADADPDAVAYHYQQAGDARAGAWLIRAGERAQRAYAWLTAAARFEAALVLLEAHPTKESTAGWLHYRLAKMRRNSDPAGGMAHLDVAEGVARETDDRALAAGVQYTRGQLRIFVGEIAGGLSELRAGVAALETLTAAEQERLNAHDDTHGGTMRSRRGLLAFHLAGSGHLTEAVAVAEEVLQGLPTDRREIARAGGLHGNAFRGLGIAYALLGRVTDARAAWAGTRAVARTMGYQVNVYYALTQELWFVILPYLTDDVAERERLLAEAEAAWKQSREMGMPPPLGVHDLGLAFVTGAWVVAREAAEAAYANPMRVFRQWARWTLAQLARAQGRVGEAAVYVREQFPAGPETEPGDVGLDFGLHVQRAAAALALDAGDLPGATAWLAAHDRWLAWSGAVQGQSEGQALWAQYHRQAGDLEQARVHAERALAHASEPRQPLALLAAHRLLGELDTDAGRSDDAAHHLDAALALADACQAPWERALTLIALADLRAATDAPDDARALLDEAQAICAPLGAQPALARIAALHAQLDAPPAAPAYPAGLSAREVEVLRLVAQGLTDAEVAEHLFLSPRTVGQHLRSVYNKLGVSSRAAATRFAVEHGLT